MTDPFLLARDNGHRLKLTGQDEHRSVYRCVECNAMLVIDEANPGFGSSLERRCEVAA